MTAPHFHSHVDDPQAVGERLRGARVAAGLSQRGLAFPGCSAAYISRLEAGDRVPSLQLLRKLAVKLGVDEGYLATGTASERARPTLLVEAEIALRFDELETAAQLYDRVLQTAGDVRSRAEALAGLGRISFRRGDPHAAILSIEDALGLQPELAAAEPGAIETLGRAYATTGELETAIAIFERALREARASEDEVVATRYAVLLANALIDNGRFDRAEELLGGALAATGPATDPAVRARLYWSQSRLHTLKGNHEVAASYARRTVELLELTEDTQYLARAHQLLGFIELERERPAEALELLRHGRGLLTDTSDALLQAQFRLEEARALAALGRTEEAISEANAVSGVLAGADPHDAGRSYALLARMLADAGDGVRAQEIYELAVELLENTSNPYLAEVYEQLGRLVEADGRTEEALGYFKSALGARQAAVPGTSR
jgi:tetratricopeptide (TPR) repeat protein